MSLHFILDSLCLFYFLCTFDSFKLQQNELFIFDSKNFLIG